MAIRLYVPRTKEERNNALREAISTGFMPGLCFYGVLVSATGPVGVLASVAIWAAVGYFTKVE